MLVHRILLFILMLAGGDVLVAQSLPLSAGSPISVGTPVANVELPDWVKAPQGELTLFAGFDHPGNDGLPLYLVNRTGNPVRFWTQDRDTLIKLERQLPSGDWERVQTHGYSDCGNSFGMWTLPQGMHLKMPAYHGEQGRQARLRYSGYGDLKVTSNVGDGFFDEAEAVRALEDRMSLDGVPSALVRLRQSEPPQVDENVSRNVAALYLTECMGELPAIRAGNEQWLTALQSLPNPNDDQRRAVPLVQACLKRDWGKCQGMEPLLRRCLAALKNGAGSPVVFGRPESEPVFVWNVVIQLAEAETSGRKLKRGWARPPKALWLEVLDLAVAQARDVKSPGTFEAVGLLAKEALVDELVSDEVFESLLGCGSTSLLQIAASALSRRGRFERVAQLGAKLIPEHQALVLRALVQPMDADGAGGGNRLRIEPSGPDEEAFWRQVLAAAPVQAASALQSLVTYPGQFNSFRRRKFEKLFDHWKKEAVRSDELARDFDLGPQAADSARSIWFMQAWHQKEDILLLRSLLGYRGYECQQTGIASAEGGEAELHIFGVRKAAAEGLKQLGETVPKDLVFEIKVEPAARQANK